MSWFVEMFTYSFMLKALIVGMLISVVTALIGVPLVLRKSSMIGDGLSHVAFGAFAIATILGFAPIWFALPVVIVASFITLRLSQNKKNSSDALIAIFSASSLAIGIIAVSVSGINIDINSYLFGSILSINWADVWLSLVLSLFVLIFYFFAHNRIFAITFDEEFARSIGIRVKIYEAIFAVICSAVIVLGMRLLGALLISSLIIFPALTAMTFARSFKKAIIYSALISIMAFVVGLIISYLVAIPTGATVVVVNLVIFVIARLIKFLVK